MMSTPLVTSTPVVRRHVADAVFEQLAASILSGELPAGASLPPEKQLASRFDVSRLIVRQAVHRLASIGLLRARQGGATLVLDWTAADHPQVGELALRHSPERTSLLRKLRERQVVGSFGMLLLAARHVTPEQVAKLRAIVNRHDLDGDHIDRLNEAFWLAIADITQNPFFLRETRYWFRVAREHAAVAERPSLSPHQRIEGYRAVIAGLENGTGVDAYHSIVRQLLDIIDASSDEP